MPVEWPSFHTKLRPQAPVSLALSIRNDSGAPGRGHTGSSRSRRPRHSAHGQRVRSSSSAKRLTWPSSNVTVTPCSRSTSTSVAVVEGSTRPNGLLIEKVRVPLGVVAIIYENRPNVTSDAFGLCLKSGNAAFLRGSSGAISSNVAIAAVLRESLAKAGLPEDALVLVEDTSREAAVEFMRQRDFVDCLVPRGGQSLVASVLEHATVPYVIDGDGNCHVYVDAAADLDQALDIVVNAKTQRPSVCNAAESLVVHEAVAERFLPPAARALKGVELVGDERTRQIVPAVGPASDDDFGREFLDLKLSIAVVPSLDA